MITHLRQIDWTCCFSQIQIIVCIDGCQPCCAHLHLHVQRCIATVEMVLSDRIQDLGELELATLVCLVASQHCIVDSDTIDSLNEAQLELQLVNFPQDFRRDGLANYRRLLLKSLGCLVQL